MTGPVSRLIDPREQHRRRAGFLAQQASFGRRGGLARAAMLSPRRRSEIAAMGGAAQAGGGPANPRPGTPLTSAELDALRHAALGLPDKQIGHVLGRSEYTVTAHLNNAFRRLGVHSRIEAFRAVGWLRVPDQ